MNLRIILAKRKKHIFSIVLSFMSGIIVGYLILGAVPWFGAPWLGGSITFVWVVDMLWGVLKEARQREEEERSKPRLEITKVNMHGDKIRVEIKNVGGSVSRGCYGRITINHTISDVLGRIPPIPTFITPQSYAQVDKESLCWAFAGNPPKIDIPIGGVPEMLEVARLVRAEIPFFDIPSEDGWGQQHPDYRKSRIRLVAKTYSGELMVGAEDVEPIVRKFELGYNNDTKNIYLELRA